jgi:group I intron endonuclease
MSKHILYSITCVINSKTYIGVTNSIITRFSSHRLKLSNKTHRNKNLQSDWDLYGRDSFLFDIICEFENKIEAHRVEKYYTDYIFCSNKELCYNIYSGGMPYFPFGNNIKPSEGAIINSNIYKSTHVVSIETRQKRSNSLKGRIFSVETRKKIKEKAHLAKKVIDINSGQIYNSLTDASILYPNIKYATLGSWLRYPNRNKTTLRWHQ